MLKVQEAVCTERAIQLRVVRVQIFEDVSYCAQSSQPRGGDGHVVEFSCRVVADSVAGTEQDLKLQLVLLLLSVWPRQFST